MIMEKVISQLQLLIVKMHRQCQGTVISVFSEAPLTGA